RLRRRAAGPAARHRPAQHARTHGGAGRYAGLPFQRPGHHPAGMAASAAPRRGRRPCSGTADMSPAADTIRLLLVDDHPLVRDGLRLRLEPVPLRERAGEAGSPAAAPACLQDCPAADPHGGTLPHLVLTDLNMPGIGGLALTAQLHEQYPQIAVLVLAMDDNAEYMV